MFTISKKEACKILFYRHLRIRLLAERGEISNLRLIEDIGKIVEYIDNEVSGKLSTDL